MEIRHQPYTITNCDFVLSSRGVLRHVNVVIDEGKIQSIGRERVGDELSCVGMTLAPGLVNAHTHTGMMYLRGYSDDQELGPWLKRVWEVESRAKEEWMRLSSELSIIEMLAGGITAFIDMYFNPFDLVQLSTKYGVRAAAGPTFLDSFKDPHEIDKEIREVARKRSPTFSPIINVHSLYAVSRQTLLLAKQLMEELDLPLHMHVSETRDELFEVKRLYGKFPVEVLASEGILGSRTILAHLGWVSSWEIVSIASSKARAVHCPTSNMKLATGGFFPINEFLQKGITLALGTDGPVSNNSLDIFREMKQAVLLQRHGYWEASVGARHVLKMGSQEGYKLLGLNGGEVKEGALADLILIDNKWLRPLTEANLESSLVYLATGRDISCTLVEGKMVYQRGISMKR
ncbi:N-ethylammeline chlorohydrolase [Sulfodiicoccus acidiphilus]|uniref:N-ethylammeline chlorohydrolase n=1 Tax=Sulfodiicoccus acidiphilus TaxID=1670455 RepID=A0A348B0M6_9CREN|nr:amidohydrolase [Sulfodiicoccus acidiphilus]BBD71728.1 N-ethylammeline chlorohydrolase [Sulfodiicoccus acidiphilus]